MSVPAPDFGTAVLAVFRLAWMRLVRGRKLRFGILATVLVVSAAIIVRYTAEDPNPERVVSESIRVGFFGMLAYLLPFLFSSGAISEEVESRTFPYLAIRPTGRFALTLGKWLAGWTMAAALLSAGVLVLHVGVWATDPSEMIEGIGPSLRAVGALALLSLCYSGLCLFWGALVVEASGLLSVLHLVTLEFAFGKLPGPFRFASMNYLATQLAGLERGGFFPEWVPDIETWLCGVILAVVSLVFLGLAALVVETSEFGFGKA